MNAALTTWSKFLHLLVKDVVSRGTFTPWTGAISSTLTVYVRLHEADRLVEVTITNRSGWWRARHHWHETFDWDFHANLDRWVALNESAEVIR